jgi:NADH-quinone oxidoreductase subunit L
MHWDIALSSIVISLVGIIIAFIFYKKENSWPDKMQKLLGNSYTYSYNKFYFDELYMFVTKKIIFKRVSTPIAWFDKNVINASVDGIAIATNYCSNKIKGIQSGQVQDYLTTMLISIIALVFITLYFIS